VSGSASTAIVERLRRLEGGGLRTFVDPDPLVWRRAEGAWIEDADGRRYLDLYGGYAVSAIGYGHPAVVEAIRTQATELIHCPSAHPSEPRARFLESLASIAPPGLDRFLPAVTGAMANEVAVAVARTRRPLGAFISFTGSYFGRGAGVVGLAGKSRYREALGLPATAQFVPFPYPYRMGPEASDQTMASLEGLVADAGGAGQLAAVMVEPVQGNGGVVIPPADFLPRLRAFCDRTGALLIADEIQSGFGRTGRMWALEHWGAWADLVTAGKGIGGGMGVAAVYGRRELFEWEPDAYTSTFLTNAVNLAAASVAIAVLRDERLAERAAEIGPTTLETMRGALEGVPGVGDVRGIGLWIGIELEDSEGRPDGGWTSRAHRRAREEGVLVGRGGHDENVIKLSPPLVINEEELERGIRTVANCIEETKGDE
jgi:4-aminobutyrate aminotransferase-like enzyme